MTEEPWIGVDLDACLARYDGFDPNDPASIGEPIPEIVELVKQWIEDGRKVKIFTGRVAKMAPKHELNRQNIKKWCLKVFGFELEVTNIKDPWMVCLYDDRAIQVEPNTGRVLGDPTMAMTCFEKDLSSYFQSDVVKNHEESSK